MCREISLKPEPRAKTLKEKYSSNISKLGNTVVFERPVIGDILAFYVAGLTAWVVEGRLNYRFFSAVVEQ